MDQKAQWERMERLREAADTAASQASNVLITFLLLGTYIAITIGSTTDEQLFKISPVTLPLLNVSLPIIGFYAFVPWLFLLFHFNLLLQLYLLARKLHTLNGVIATLGDDTARKELRTQLFSFPFSHMLIGSHYAWLMRVFLGLFVWVSVVLMPLMLLTWAQIRFLPYHDGTVTWSQRLAVGLDLILLWFFWPIIADPDGYAKNWWKQIGVGFSRFVSAMKRQVRARQQAQTKRARGFLTLSVTSVVIALLSLFLASQPKYGKRDSRTYFPIIYWLFERPGAPFHRNLRLSEKILIAGEPPAAVVTALRGENEKARETALQSLMGLNLVNRDFRFANFTNTVLSKADLRGVNLDGADLSLADLSASDLRPFGVTGGGRCVLKMQERSLDKDEQRRVDLKPVREEDGDFCLTSLQNATLSGISLSNARLPFVNIQGADLRDAQLKDADLRDAQLQGADLARAQLQGADLARAQLQGADLRDAQLQGADLRDAQLQGADLARAQLQGADLARAQLQGADLRDAQLQGADLALAQLRGATLPGAQLQGAVLEQAQLQGADLSLVQFQGAVMEQAQLQGTDLRFAMVGGVRFGEADLSLSDLRELNRELLDQKAYDSLAQILKDTVNDEKLRSILKRLEAATRQRDNLQQSHAENLLCDSTKPVETCLTEDKIKHYDTKLGQFLGEISCNDANIARGVVRRVVESEPTRLLGSLLAAKLLEQSCKGGAALSKEVKDKLQGIPIRTKP